MSRSKLCIRFKNQSFYLDAFETLSLTIMSLPKTVLMKSANGDIEIPTIGFGTWAAGDTSWCYDATLKALRAGYRHLDCAWNYGVSHSC